MSIRHCRIDFYLPGLMCPSFAGLSETPYHPLLACALFIVPGVPLINFVDDMIDNYIQVALCGL